MKPNPLTPSEYEQCLDYLQRIADGYRAAPLDPRFNALIQKLFHEGKKRLDDGRKAEKQRKRQEDRALLANTALVAQQSDLPLQLSAGHSSGELHEPENCYICKQEYRLVHFFYHFLCPDCAANNYAMRDLHADLSGRVALVTGGRVKIGHQLVLRLLRDGARVLVTTRFPHAAAKRFAAEPDYQEFGDRLHLYGLDLRNIPAVEEFAAELNRSLSCLDIVVHNAAQTIQRPAGFYTELVLQEREPEKYLSPQARRLVLRAAPTTIGIYDSYAMLPAALTQVPELMSAPVPDILPLNELHDNEERADSRAVNSWLLPLEDVSAREMLEVQLVNSVAPFLLNARLKRLLLRSPYNRRFIVNVSAMEGQFSRHKTIFHPHTNMAKAALNMMTHTSAAGLAKDGIFMNSVDTGWVTDENPTPIRLRKQQEEGFFAPLDIVDGMARIYHPIADGINLPQTPYFGEFLKDYRPCKW